MGVVSNGMLCSGDELNLTTDADGILILPPETPLGVQLSDLYGDVVLDVDVKPNRGDALSLIGLAREVAAATGGTVRWPDIQVRGVAASPSTQSLDGRGPRAGAVHAVRGPPRVGRDDRAVAGPGPDAPPRGRHAADQQRRGCVELRDARDGQAHPHVRRRRRSTTAGSSSAARRPASSSRRWTTSSARSTRKPSSSPIRTAPLGIAGIMGGAASEVADTTRDVDRRVGDLRPGEHPPDRPAVRAPIRGEPPVREGPGSPAGADRRRPRRAAARRVGGRHRRRQVASTRPRPSPARRASPFRPARVNRLLGVATFRRPTSAALLGPRRGRDRARAGRDRRRASAGRRSRRSSSSTDARPATVLLAVVPTWRRDIVIEADVAEEVARVRGYERDAGDAAGHAAAALSGRRRSRSRDEIREVLAGAGLLGSRHPRARRRRTRTSGSTGRWPPRRAWPGEGDAAFDRRSAS